MSSARNSLPVPHAAVMRARPATVFKKRHATVAVNRLRGDWVRFRRTGVNYVA